MGGRAWTTLLLVIVLSGCGGPMVWRESSLNQLSVGMSKDEVLRLYPSQYTDSSGSRRDVEGMEIRSVRTSDPCSCNATTTPSPMSDKVAAITANG